MPASNAYSEPSPLTEATTFIMLSLAVQPRHGYAILKDVQELSAGRVILSTGTLYGVLKRLLETGWIVVVKDREAASPAPPAGKARKEYLLSELGRKVLEAESARIDMLATTLHLNLKAAGT